MLNKMDNQNYLNQGSVKLLPLFLLLVLMCFSGCVGTNTPQGWSSGIVVDSILYTGTMDGDVRAIDIKEGDLIWKFDELKGESSLTHAIYGTPVISGDTLFIGAYDGFLYAISTKDGDDNIVHIKHLIPRIGCSVFNPSPMAHSSVVDKDI